MSDIERHGVTARYADAVIHNDVIHLVEVPSTSTADITVQTREVLASIERELGARATAVTLVWRLLERIGARLWPRIKPLAGKFLPFTSAWQAFPLGMVWGWLPCGLVYSMLTWSAAAGSAGGGALIMLSFGIGTLPTLFALGGLADRLRYWLTLRSLRQGGAVLLIAYGLHTLWIGIASF